MKTLIISSSLSKTSKSLILCKEVALALSKKKVNCSVIDSRKLLINPTHKTETEDMKKLQHQIKKADNIIIGMGVHNYSVSDNLKIIMDTCFSDAHGKFFGIVCAAGGEKSYLSTIHISQICMNQWKMIQLPQIIYATNKDFQNNTISSNEVIKILQKFCEEFYKIGKKLLD
tara:strand:+ start:1034 stop:1549 length:516 start_codon:yes stop_codon:yes gene_type:complete